MRKLRIAVGGFHHETNTFSPRETTFRDFEIADGWPALSTREEMLRAVKGVNIPIAGFIEEAEKLGAEVVPLLWCSAQPAGVVESEAFEKVMGMLVELVTSHQSRVASREAGSVLPLSHRGRVAEPLGDAGRGQRAEDNPSPNQLTSPALADLTLPQGESKSTESTSSATSLTPNLDAIFLDLHGAMVTEDYEDAEAEILRRVRAVAPNVPIFLALDFHANVSPEMVELSGYIASYRNYPHTDMAETGRRVARKVASSKLQVAGNTSTLKKLPFLIPITAQCTLSPPASGVLEVLYKAEEKYSASIALCYGFPMADTSITSPAIVAYAETKEASEASASMVYDFMHSKRAEFQSPILSPEVAVSRSLQSEPVHRKPVIIADTEDNPGAGAASDNMVMAKAFLDCMALSEGLRVEECSDDPAEGVGVKAVRPGGETHLNKNYSAQRLDESSPQPFATRYILQVKRLFTGVTPEKKILIANIFDPESAAKAHEVGVGSVVDLSLGGKSDGAPLIAQYKVLALGDGEFEGHGAMYGGSRMRLGKVAVLEVVTSQQPSDPLASPATYHLPSSASKIQLIVTSVKQQAGDRGVMLHLGINPEDYGILVLKSSVHFQADFREVASEILFVASGGLNVSELSRLDYQRLTLK